MRLGIRLQLLLALGSLLVLAFVPLFFAFARLTQATMSAAREGNARALGRSIAGHVIAAHPGRGDLGALLEAQVGQQGALSIAVYDERGALVASAGGKAPFPALPSAVTPGIERVSSVQTGRGGAVLVVMPLERNAGAVAVVVGADAETRTETPLVRLFALYTGLVAMALLVFAYISLTHLVVRPIDTLAREARRVEGGARRLEAPLRGARELVELGQSMAEMTERLRADEEAQKAKMLEIQRYAADLERAQEQLVRAERLAVVGHLAAGLAHEIGNPLSAILGFQELLLHGGLDPRDEREFLERMKRETERIHRVLRDLLDFARPAASGEGGRPQATEPCGVVADAVASVLALVKPQKEFQPITLVTEIEPGLPRVLLSTGRLVQILLNLLLNAAAVVPREQGRILVRARKSSEDRVRLEVEDNGPGVEPSLRERLFEPFVTTKEVGKGTGLGLSVCQGLLKAAGGTIGFEEGSEGGARFVVDLPTEQPSP